jgi:hypothetical protein
LVLYGEFNDDLFLLIINYLLSKMVLTV